MRRVSGFGVNRLAYFGRRARPPRHFDHMRKQRTRPGKIGVVTFIERARLVRETARDQAPEAGEVSQATSRRKVGSVRLARRQIEDSGAIFSDDQYLTVRDGGNGNTGIRPSCGRLMLRPDWR
jgi:hypothetical protein